MLDSKWDGGGKSSGGSADVLGLLRSAVLLCVFRSRSGYRGDPRACVSRKVEYRWRKEMARSGEPNTRSPVWRYVKYKGTEKIVPPKIF